MSKFPIRIRNSNIHFALRGRLSSDFELLAISENCPVGLHNAMPNNSAGKTSGRLARMWFNSLCRDYNWAYSDHLPKITQPADPSSESPEKSAIEIKHNDVSIFYPESRLHFAWRAYSNKNMRSAVQKQLDRQKLEICKAILDKDELTLADALAPVILECEGYSTVDYYT
jgi:hypothetical protein